MKRYIRAFAFTRKKAIDKLDGPSIEVNEHVIKCVIFGGYRKDSYNHWIHEISSWLQSCDSRGISGANLKDRDYRESLFGHFGDCVSDAENNLLHFKSSNLYKHHKKNPTTALPYYRINDEMIDCLYDCYVELMDTCIPILQSSKEHNLSFWKKLVKSIIDSHIYDFKDEDIVENIYDE